MATGPVIRTVSGARLTPTVCRLMQFPPCCSVRLGGRWSSEKDRLCRTLALTKIGQSSGRLRLQFRSMSIWKRMPVRWFPRIARRAFRGIHPDDERNWLVECPGVGRVFDTLWIVAPPAIPPKAETKTFGPEYGSGFDVLTW